jgi:hypothetical protein
VRGSREFADDPGNWESLIRNYQAPTAKTADIPMRFLQGEKKG